MTVLEILAMCHVKHEGHAMKMYRNNYRNRHEESEGYGFYPNAAAAKKAAREYVKETGDGIVDTEAIEVTPTKAGIIAALNKYASHNDNG